MTSLRAVLASTVLAAGLLALGTTTARADAYSDLVTINGFTFTAANSTDNTAEYVSLGTGPGSPPAGTVVATGADVIISVDSGNVYYAIVQPIGLNNNAYGTTSTGGTSAPFNWSGKGHKLSDLTSSDEATMSFSNGTGSTVLSFAQDYLDQNGGPGPGGGTVTPPVSSTYSGGDGTSPTGSGLTSCPAGNKCVLASTSSLAYDLNSYDTTGIYSTNSPTLTQQSGWINADVYEGEISAAAFGTSGFGALSISLIHNSPSEISGADKTSIVCTGPGGCTFKPPSTTTTSVPEPGSLALLGTALLGLGLLARRRRRNG